MPDSQSTAPSSDSNVRLLSNDVLAGKLLEDFPYRIQLARRLPILPLSGDRLRYATTGPVKTAITITNKEHIPDDTKQPRDPNRVHTISELATRFCVSYRSQDIGSSNVNDQAAVQMALAVRSLLYKFWTLFETGNSKTHSGEFDGLEQLVDPGNVVDLEGRPLSTVDLQWAKEKVRANDGRAIATFTSAVGKIAIQEATFQRGAMPRYESWSLETPCGRWQDEMSPVWDGSPIYVNDLNRTNTASDVGGEPISPADLDNYAPHDLVTNIWFFVLGPKHLHGIMPKQSESIVVRSTIVPDESATTYHVTMPIGLALGSSASLAVIKNAAIPQAAARS